MQPIQESNLFEASLDVHGIDWVVVFAYFDDTSGGARGELSGWAGYVFDPAGASRFRELYREKVEPLLPPDQSGRRIFRAAKIHALQGQFAGLRDFREHIFKQMVAVLAETVTVGAVVCIEKPEYERGLKGRVINVRVKGHPSTNLRPWAGSPYSLCLLRCIQLLNQWMDEQRMSGDIEYVFENGTPHQPEIDGMLSRVGSNPDFAKRFRWAKYSFAEKGPKAPWLFAPDYFAWEWQRYDRNAEEPERGEWRTTILPLIEAKTHLASILTEASVNTQAAINVFNGLMGPSTTLSDPRIRSAI